MRGIPVWRAVLIVGAALASLPAYAASFRNHIARVPEQPRSTDTVRVWVESDTAFGETILLEYHVIGTGDYPRVEGSYDTTGPSPANWRIDIPAQPAGAQVEYQILTRNQGNFVYDYTGFNWNYKVRGVVAGGAAWASTVSDVVSQPTVYNGRAYVVDNAGALRALMVADGQPDAAFGTVGLGAPVTGRVAVRGTPAGVRLYMVTSAGQLWMMDAGTGASARQIAPALLDTSLSPAVSRPAVAATTRATPAIVVESGVTSVYFTVKDSDGKVYLCRATDAASPAFTSVLLEMATDATSPSVVADGARVQLGATQAGGSGRVYSVITSSMAVTQMAGTVGPVVAPPLLSYQPDVFYVGDAPGTGNGRMYAFFASNSAPVTAWGVNGEVLLTGRVENAPFPDYNPTRNDPTHQAASILYVGTSAGHVYGVRSTDGGIAASATINAASVSGGLLLLNNNLYVPTTAGMIVTPTSDLATQTVFPPAIGFSTPSVTLSGGTIVSTGSDGKEYGLVAQ